MNFSTLLTQRLPVALFTQTKSVRNKNIEREKQRESGKIDGRIMLIINHIMKTSEKKKNYITKVLF